VTTSPEAVADLILNAMPEAPRSADDAEYVPRFADLMRLVERAGMLPIAYADYFDHDKGWEIGWGGKSPGTEHFDLVILAIGYGL